MLPIKVHLTPSGPNGWKVVHILEELNIPYELNCFKSDQVKQKPYIDINPNGRTPAIEDPNTGLTLWESGAIIHYIIEQYDVDHKLSYETLNERHLCNQWLAFQISGQGPYFGQLAWFNHVHPETIQSAIDRYVHEMRRILGVLEGVLDGKQWLVGDKMTYSDLSFTVWNDRMDFLAKIPREKAFEGLPNVQAWHERMTNRPAWTSTMQKRAQCLDEQGLQSNGAPKGMSWDEYSAALKAQMQSAKK